MKPSRLPPFPQPLEIARERRFHTFPPQDCYWVYTDISNGRTTLSFLKSSNTMCSRKLEMVLAHIW